MITIPWVMPRTPPLIPGRVKVIHGVHDMAFDCLVNKSVGTIQRSLQEVFNIPADAKALLNGHQVSPDHRLGANDVLEFVRARGRKGALEPEELARLEQIESRLKQIESQIPTVASLSEAVVRVADHLVPPAASIVGSKYVADRLGCSTTWVGRMAFRGMIPRKCVVSGTGNGRLWKFHRNQIDDWLAARSTNGIT